MMVNKFGVFDDITEVVRRVKELKAEGVDEQDIHLYSKANPSSELMANYNVQIHRGKGSAFQKFTSMFSKESAEDKVTDDLKLTDEEADYYHQVLEEGKFVLVVEQSAKLESLNKKPVAEFGEGKDDSVHIDLNKRKDYEL